MTTRKKLNRYELEQIEEIKAWEKEEPKMMHKISSYINSTVATVAGMLYEKIPKNIKNKINAKYKKKVENTIKEAVAKGLEGADKAAETITLEKLVMKMAKIDDISVMRTRNLKVSDKLAHKMHVKLNQGSLLEGAGTGFYGFGGMLADIPSFIVLQYLAIYQIGLCYGYKSTDDEMKAIQLEILNIAFSDTLSAKSEAINELKSILEICEKPMQDIVKTAAKKSTSKEAILLKIKKIIDKLISKVFKKESDVALDELAGKGVPVLSAAFSACINIYTMDEICWTARRVFQRKWLIDNGKWNDEKINTIQLLSEEPLTVKIREVDCSKIESDVSDMK